MWSTAILYEPAGEDRVRCTLCPFRCVVGAGQSGACRVRRGEPGSGSVLQTATFATSVVHRDAIERKPFFHYRPGTTAVTLAAPGCSFRCDYCINFRISQYGRDVASGWIAEPVSAGGGDAAPRSAESDAPSIAGIVALAEEAGGCVALSYSEPSLAIELTLALADAGAAVGVDVVWKSNGFLTPAAVAVAAPALAAVNIDLKGVDDARHRRLTGAPVGPVLDTIADFRSRGVWVEVTTPLVPGVAESAADLAATAARLAAIDPGIPWHLARFTPAYRMADGDPTQPAALSQGVDVGRAAGLRHVYVERALGAAGRATRCPRCDAVVVERGVWSTMDNRLIGGCCPGCGRRVEGRW